MRPQGYMATTIYRGRVKPWKARDLFDVAEILELADEKALDLAGEGCDGWLDIVSAEVESDILKALQVVIDKHDLKPCKFLVEDIEELLVSVHNGKVIGVYSV